MVEITVSPPDAPPFAVELIVLEEDRWLVLSAKSRLVPERRPTEELVASMRAASVPDVGEVLFQGNRALAIVHDLETIPTFQASALTIALQRIADHCREQGIHSLAMQPLGAVYGPLSIDEFRETLQAMDLGPVARIWLIE